MSPILPPREVPPSGKPAWRFYRDPIHYGHPRLKIEIFRQRWPDILPRVDSSAYWVRYWNLWVRVWGWTHCYHFVHHVERRP